MIDPYPTQQPPPLDLIKLQQDYSDIMSTMRSELRMRKRVFEHKPDLLISKVAEIEQCIDIIVRWKDELKTRLQPADQLPLIEHKEVKRNY